MLFDSDKTGTGKAPSRSSFGLQWRSRGEKPPEAPKISQLLKPENSLGYYDFLSIL